MSNQIRRSTFRRVLVDMNTQCDFLLPRGAVPVANRTEILPNIRKLMNWGRVERIPIISSLECHRPGETNNGLPPYCIDHSAGQRKLPFTLMPRRMLLHGDNTLDLPLDPFRRYRQLIFTKRCVDFLSNPKADRLINMLGADQYIIFGATAERCVKAAALGLVARRRRVLVVTDACGYWCATEASLAFRQMEAKGVLLGKAQDVLNGTVDRWFAAFEPPAVPDEEDSSAAVLQTPNGNGVDRKTSIWLNVAAAPLRPDHAAKPNGIGKKPARIHSRLLVPAPTPGRKTNAPTDRPRTRTD